MRLIDLTGQKFGRWSVRERAASGRWRCACVCGIEKEVSGLVLRAGKSKSCGCYRVDAGRVLGAASRTHGHCRNGRLSPEYNIWASMLDRCSNPNTPNFENYGARGIRVCKRWLKFENFLADMGSRPPGRRGNRPLYSLDRRNNNGNYSPGNCRWATPEKQNNNRRERQ